VSVLVIEENAAEAALVAAALALRPEVQVVDAPDLSGALERLQAPAAPFGLAIVGARALATSTAELVGRLGAKGVPVVVIAAGLAADARQKALDTGVREVYDRPSEWRAYADLIELVMSRFIRTDSPPRPNRTN
jgi:DNA-binding NarL/FixJ family response regulator